MSSASSDGSSSISEALLAPADVGSWESSIDSDSGVGGECASGRVGIGVSAGGQAIGRCPQVMPCRLHFFCNYAAVVVHVQVQMAVVMTLVVAVWLAHV